MILLAGLAAACYYPPSEETIETAEDVFDSALFTVTDVLGFENDEKVERGAWEWQSVACRGGGGNSLEHSVHWTGVTEKEAKEVATALLSAWEADARIDDGPHLNTGPTPYLDYEGEEGRVSVHAWLDFTSGSTEVRGRYRTPDQRRQLETFELRVWVHSCPYRG